MNTEIFRFQIEETPLTEIMVIDIDGNIWFVATDVCKLLGLSNTSETLRSLDEDEKLTSVILRSGQKRKTNLINESGLYALIFRSRKDFAQIFRKWVTKEVIPSIRKKGFYTKAQATDLPNFYLRYKQNYFKVENEYFSVINELFITLNMEFEKLGYQIPAFGADGKPLYPDISVGQTFATYLKENDATFYENAKTYTHTFPDGRKPVEAKKYPVEALPIFRKFVYEQWIPKYAKKYFAKRAPQALTWLDKMLVQKTQ